MKHFKYLLFYWKDFLPIFEKTILLNKKQFCFIHYLFILLIFFCNFSVAFALPSSNSHNEHKLFSKLSDFLDTHDSITPEMKEKAIQKIIDFEKEFKITPTNEAKTLRKLFFAVQETFFKEYILYASFFQTIDSGKYDCLTGSVLYGIFLEEIKKKGNFGYTYQIIQQPTHIFIKIELTDKSEIIFESTSLENGFIATPKGVEFYLKEQTILAQNQLADETVLVANNHKLNNLVTLESIAALLYFNQGVLFFNQRKFGKCLKMAKNALYFDKNESYYELIQLSLQELSKNNLISEKEYNNNIFKFNLVKN